MDVSYLRPKECSVVIAGRKFILREMSASRLEHYLNEIGSISISDLPVADPGALNCINERGKRFIQFICWLLDYVDEKFIIDNFTPDIIWNLIDIQNRLNGVEELLKKTV